MNKLLLMFFVGLFASVFLVGVVTAVTYTVGSGGTYSTIQACANAANSGDICSIKAGTYNERVNVNKAGVSFVGEGYRTAIVNGGFVVNVANTRIEDLRITTTSRVNAGVMLWEAADGTKIYDNYFFDVNAEHGIWGPFGSTDTANNVHVKDNLFHRVQVGIHAVGNNWIIENNEIDSLYEWGSGGCQYTRFHGSNQIWRNNYWHGATLADTGSGHVDCFQTWDQGNPHLTRNVTIENNTCINFHAFGMIQAQEGGSQLDGLKIRNNIGYVRPDSGYIQSSGGTFALNIEDATNMVIEHNTFIGATWYSIYFNDIGSSDHPSGVMKNNLIMDVGTEAWNANGCNGDCSVKYNIWYTAQNPTPTPDSTNKNVNPQLTDINNLNFKPAAGSPACTGGEGGTYIGAVSCNSSSSQGPDTNGDGCVSLSEVSAYVSLWLNNGGVTLSQVSAGVAQWLAGCGPAPVCTAGQTRSCTTGLQGVCSAGTQTCTNNAWGSCAQNTQSSTETCTDTLDNDCDGATDCSDSNCAANSACASSGNCTVTVNTRSALQTAINNAAAGAVICIAPGTYAASGGNQIEVNTAGITIKGQTRRTATVIDGFHVNAANVKIEGLRMTTSVQQWFGLVFLDTNADYAKVYDNYFYDADVFTAIRSETGNLGDASNVHIKGNLFYRCNGGVHATGNNWLVEDNEIDTLIRWGSHDNNNFVIFGNNHVFRNNYMHGTTLNSTGGSHVDCFQTYDWTNAYTVHNLLIENNTCYGFHEFAMIQAWDHDHDNITIRNNIGVNFPNGGYFSGYCSPGDICPLRPIIVEGSVPNLKIEHNTIIGASDNAGMVFSVSAGQNSVIKNNLMASVLSGGSYGSGYYADCSPACNIGYNMIWNVAQQGTPASSTNIMQSTGFVDPIVTSNRSKWKPTNSIACTGGEGGTYIGAVPCN